MGKSNKYIVVSLSVPLFILFLYLNRVVYFVFTVTNRRVVRVGGGMGVVCIPVYIRSRMLLSQEMHLL